MSSMTRPARAAWALVLLRSKMNTQSLTQLLFLNSHKKLQVALYVAMISLLWITLNFG